MNESQSLGENPAATWTMRDIDDITFARMLAKVAHCVAIARRGINKFEPLLASVILRGENCAYVVGGVTERIEPPVHMPMWVRTEVRPIGGVRYVVVFMRFFAYVGPPEKGTPTYSVVVGRFIPWHERLTRWGGSLPHTIAQRLRGIAERVWRKESGGSEPPLSF